MKRRPSVIRLTIDRRAALVLAAAVFVAGAALLVSSETLTLSTTYPAPVGVYNQIITTGDAGTVAAMTVLARNAGHVLLTPPTNPSGNVGIGVVDPAVKLDVGGAIRPGRMSSDPAGSVEGAIYFNTARGQLRVFANGAWTDVGAAAVGSFCGYMPMMRGLGTASPSVPCDGRELSRGCPARFAAVNLGIGITCVRQ